VQPFRFRLERVLRWRRAELELAQFQMKRLSAEMDAVERDRAQAAAARAAAPGELARIRPLDGAALAAHASYLEGLARRQGELAQRRRELEKRIAEQHARLLEARRRVRVLEQFRARSLAEWQAAADRELEQLAAESHLARWMAGER